jgi:hypothetical protein
MVGAATQGRGSSFHPIILNNHSRRRSDWQLGRGRRTTFCVGLASKPNRRRKRIRVLGLNNSTRGWVSRSNQKCGPGHYPDPGHNSNLDHLLDPGQKLVPGSMVSLEPDCEDASSAVRASGLPLIPERYVAGDGSTGDGLEFPLLPMNGLGDKTGSTDDGSDANEGIAGDGSVGEALLPVPSSTIPSAEDLLAPKSRSGLDFESDSSDSDLDSGFITSLGPGSVPPPGSWVWLIILPLRRLSLRSLKESRSHFLSEPCSLDSPQVGFGLTKSQIWLLEWMKDKLKNHIEVKDEDHSAFLKDMEEDFRWLNTVAREQGWMEVDEKDFGWIKMVVREDGRWEVDEEEEDRMVEWLNEVKEGLRITVDWPSPKGKTITL